MINVDIKMNRDQKILISIIILVLIGAGWFIYDTRRLEAFEFAGNMKGFSENVILVEGDEVISEGKSATQELKTVEVIVKKDTKITRESFVLPSDKELEKTGGMYQPDKLPKQRSVSDLATLKSDFDRYGTSIIIKTDKNIFGENKFEAQEILYIVAFLPTH